MNKFALLCPGQGAQSAQMFALASQHTGADSFVQDVLKQTIHQHALADVLSSTALLFENRYAQPLLVAATLANWLALKQHLPVPDLVAGYSVGEVAAHAVSGSMEVLAALELATARAALMQACVHAPQRMLAVSGIAIEDIRHFVAGHDLHIAIITADNKAIIAGLATHISAAIPDILLLPGHDIGYTEVAVHIASHTPLMQAAATDFAQVLMDTTICDTDVGVLAGITGETVTAPAAIRSSLLAQMTQTIQWHACMDAMAESGIRFALELGPGAALSRMLQLRHPHIACRSVADFRSLEGVIQWVQRQREN
ncbi:acyltransferase domain-containing protein [Undibacterium sp. CY18W]|uniref:Acyltransferase domain-containing protein n=1 Tax=Undibacterium hunanense TaxID=2762292 RepID=A0ABR6ZXA5_9BURK|nr:acyltransferase domain-containing protein [Undibacterium hunanense]MBC3920486.1 acyltransferase domain-containing protein [Undibacterium hunanense]